MKTEGTLKTLRANETDKIVAVVLWSANVDEFTFQLMSLQERE